MLQRGASKSQGGSAHTVSCFGEAKGERRQRRSNQSGIKPVKLFDLNLTWIFALLELMAWSLLLGHKCWGGGQSYYPRLSIYKEFTNTNKVSSKPVLLTRCSASQEIFMSPLYRYSSPLFFLESAYWSEKALNEYQEGNFQDRFAFWSGGAFWTKGAKVSKGRDF